MATLLATSKMSPELAARVEASVRGRRSAHAVRRRSRVVALLRLAAVVAVVGAATSVLVATRRARERLEADRAALLGRLRAASADIGARERAAPARIATWLERCSTPAYAGDLIADELRDDSALEETLRRPIVYVRGPLASFAKSSKLLETAASSFKDSFVTCLVDPPTSRTEKRLLASARAAYVAAPAGDAGRLQGSGARGIERLYHALHGLPFLSSSWEQLVIAASRSELDALTRAFERAPIERAVRAARAELLVFAMDEPSDVREPAELDGERPHDVRVGIVDLVSLKQLVALRRRVDPRWLSASVRAEYAAAVDGCTLAYDLRTEVGSGALRSGG